MSRKVPLTQHSQPPPHPRRTVMRCLSEALHDGVACFVLTKDTARSVMHKNVAAMLDACWTKEFVVRVFQSVTRALARDERRWSLGNRGDTGSTLHHVLSNKPVSTGEATRLEIGICSIKQDKCAREEGHPLRTLFDGVGSRDDLDVLAKVVKAFDALLVDKRVVPDHLVFTVGPHKGPSVARTHHDDYLNYSFQVRMCPPLRPASSPCTHHCQYPKHHTQTDRRRAWAGRWLASRCGIFFHGPS